MLLTPECFSVCGSSALPHAGAPAKVFLLRRRLRLSLCILNLLAVLTLSLRFLFPPLPLRAPPPGRLFPSAVVTVIHHTLAHFGWLSCECGDFYLFPFFFFLNHSSFLVSRTALAIQWSLNKVLLNGRRALLIIFTGVII